MTVELIYFNGCPNIGLARERLLRAFAASGITPHWQEWERNDPASPAHARAYGSPTVLVNGRDVAGLEPGSDDAGACRVYSHAPGVLERAPAVTLIAEALRNTGAGEAPRTGWRGALATLPAIGAGALPKLTCPACWPAYSGLLSSMGVGFVDYTPYILPLTVLFLLLSLAALGWRAPGRRGYGPLSLGVAASVLLLVGRFVLDSDAGMYAGMAVLVTASLWNAWPRTRSAAGSCPACIPASPQ